MLRRRKKQKKQGGKCRLPDPVSSLIFIFDNNKPHSGSGVAFSKTDRPVQVQQGWQFIDSHRFLKPDQA